MKKRWAWVTVAVVVLLVVGAAGVLLTSDSAREAAELAAEGGEITLREPMNPIRDGTRVLLIALDGVGDEELRTMVESGRMPHLGRLFGAQRDEDLYAHAYAVPGALSIIPSTTMAVWASIFTGKPVSETGIPGNEWYAREEMRFYAPGPNTVEETDHTILSYTEGLLGNAIRVPTLFEMTDVRTHVSLMTIHRGADLLTTPELSDVARAFGATAAGVLHDEPADRGMYRVLDEGSVDNLLRSMERHGVPDLQVVYFPGIDLYTHVADEPLVELSRYLEEVTDPAIGRILEAYARAGVLDRTYVMLTADHGHTPVIKEESHALGTGKEGEPPEVLQRAGFRMRPFVLEPEEEGERDYQATVAYQGAIAYVYLADRSTCVRPGERCSWMLPPRLEEDVLPVVRAFDRANRFGEGVPQLRGTLDLILAREPRPPGEDALPYQVWNGERLITIGDYLAANPRPEFPRFEERMRELAAGPYGHRAGDVLLLARSGMHRPLHERYYFSRVYSSWHGSPEWQDSRIPIIVAHPGRTGEQIRGVVGEVVGAEPSQLDITPLVLRLLQQP
jgi:hypothetical protein